MENRQKTWSIRVCLCIFLLCIIYIDYQLRTNKWKLLTAYLDSHWSVHSSHDPALHKLKKNNQYLCLLPKFCWFLISKSTWFQLNCWKERRASGSRRQPSKRASLSCHQDERLAKSVASNLHRIPVVKYVCTYMCLFLLL